MKNNIYKQITNQIINAIENGCFEKWIQPWTFGLPYNALSGHQYRGINQIILGYQTWIKGYNDPRWVTFNQAKKLSGRIRKGEKSTLIIFWKFVEIKDAPEESGEAEESQVKKIPLARAYRVFNVEQCSGLNLSPLKENQFDIDKTLHSLLSLPKIEWGGNRACYIPDRDVIRMPQKGKFHDVEGFKETFCHELTHWTGHKSRLNRNLKNRFGNAQYAMEELIAELGAAFILGHIGVPLTKTQCAPYIDSWLQVLRKDNRAIFTAAREAQEACDFILKKAGLQKCGEEIKEAA